MAADQQSSNPRGARTWRLALAFFGGVGGGLLIANELVIPAQVPVGRSNTEWPSGSIWLVLLWPATHASVVWLCSYLSYIEAFLGRVSFLAQPPNRMRMVMNLLVGACLLSYGASVVLSLWARMRLR